VSESLRIRKDKMLARRRDRRLLAQGKLKVEQVCLAANAEMNPKPPLIFRKVKLAEDEGLGDA
jgi:hypothetical protein